MEKYPKSEQGSATADIRVPADFDDRIITRALDAGHANRVVVGGVLKVLFPDYRAEPAKEAPVEQGGFDYMIP